MITTVWLRKASAARFELPLGATLGLALAFFLFAMPEPLFDGYFAATALPLLGFPGRAIAALGFGALAGWGTWRALAAAGPSRDRWKVDLGKQSFVPRRADAHPDAPPRRPIFAASDLGAPMDEAPPIKPRNRNPLRASVADAVAAEPVSVALEAPAAMIAPPLEQAAVEPAEATIVEPAEVAPVQAGQPAASPLTVAVEASAPVARWTLAPQPEPAPVSEVASYAPTTLTPTEGESIAALMQRLEDGLARAPAEAQVGSTAGAWLVRNGDAKQAAGKR